MLSVEQVKKTLELLKRESVKTDDTEQEKKLTELMDSYNGPDELITSKDILRSLEEQPEEETYLTGHESVDRLLRGFRPTQLIVLSAPTKSGKTAYCMDISSNMKEANPLWLPFEETAEELVRRFIESGLECPHFVTPREIRGNKVSWVEMKIIESVVKFNTKVVFIDHLHFMLDRNDHMADEIGFVVRELKTIARRWNVAIVLVCHLKKTNVEVQPTLEDLRGSSFIAQDADTVIMLWREHKRKEDGQVIITNNIVVSVQANRRFGKTGNVKFTYDSGRFVENEWKSADDLFVSL